MSAPLRTRVLIVAKTHMRDGACIGGLMLDNNRNVRLLPPYGKCQPVETPFDVGQIWNLEYQPVYGGIPPHVEDVRVFNQQLEGEQTDLREYLLPRVQAWSGPPESLFDGLLSSTSAGSWHLLRSSGMPNCSVGYWIPDQPLYSYESYGNIYFRYQDPNSWQFTKVKYVGYASASGVSHIPAGTLVRVSLARWWSPQDSDQEESCYLQLSGWYLKGAATPHIGGAHKEPAIVTEDLPILIADTHTPLRAKSAEAHVADPLGPKLLKVKDLHVGDRVTHAQFGKGTVASLQITSGIIVIEFDNVGTKRLSPAVAPLERI